MFFSKIFAAVRRCGEGIVKLCSTIIIFYKRGMGDKL